MWSIVEQVSVSGIRLSDLAALRVPYVGRDTQDDVAELLRPYDDKIAAGRRIGEVLEGMVRTLYRAWFVDYEPMRPSTKHTWPSDVQRLFPDGFSDRSLPSGWQTGTMADIAERVVERVRTPAEWATEVLIDLGRIPRETLALREWGSGSEMTTSVTRFRRGDVLFGSIRPYLHKVGLAPCAGVTNTSVFAIRAKEEAWSPYVAALCSDEATVRFATRVSQGLKMPSVRWKDLASLELAIPPEALIQRYAEIAGPWLEGLIQTVAEGNSLRAARDTIGDRLFYEVFNGSDDQGRA